MTEEIVQNDSQEEQSGPSEIELLKMKADRLGIKYSPNIGVDTLRERVNEKLGDEEPEEGVTLNGMTPSQLRIYAREKALKLVRIRVTNMDPVDQQSKGAWITASNAYVQPIRKFIPYGAGTDNGYHVPSIILKQLQEKTYIRRTPDPKQPTLFKSEIAKKYAIEILPPLTKEELKQLADDQRTTQRLVD